MCGVFGFCGVVVSGVGSIWFGGLCIMILCLGWFCLFGCDEVFIFMFSLVFNFD